MKGGDLSGFPYGESIGTADMRTFDLTNRQTISGKQTATIVSFQAHQIASAQWQHQRTAKKSTAFAEKPQKLNDDQIVSGENFVNSDAKEEKSNPADDSEIFLPSHNNTTDVDINPHCEQPSISEQPSHQVNRQEQGQTSRLQVNSQKTENEVA